jgi:hypothetical protein
MPSPDRAIGYGNPLDNMDLLSRIRPDETDIHAMLETMAMMAGERPRIENLCESSSSVDFTMVVVVVLGLEERRGYSSLSLGDRGIFVFGLDPSSC